MSMENPGNAGTSSSEVSNMLVQGFKAAKEGRREEAYNIFCEVVRSEPGNELGWLYRAATTDDLSEAYVCLQRVLSINPNNEKAQRGIERIQARLSAEEESAAQNVPPVPPSQPPVTQPTARFGEDNVVSGFNQPNPAFRNQPGGNGSQETMPFARDDAAYYNRSGTTAPQSNFTPPPPPPSAAYRPDFEGGQSAGNYGGYQQAPYNNPYGQPSYTTEDEMVDEPVQDIGANRGQARFGEGREQTSSGRRPGAGLAPVFGSMANARQRGKRALTGEDATNLDNTGRRRANRLLGYLIALAVLVIIIAAILLFLTRPQANNSTDQAAATSTAAVTTGTGGSTTAGGAMTGGAPEATTAGGANATASGGQTGPASTVPVVGATTPAGEATTAPAQGGQTTAANGGDQGQATTAAPPPAATTAPPAPAQPRPAVYTVVRGDSMYRIASKFSTSIDALRAANRSTVQNDRIFAGNQVVVPVSRPDFRGRDGYIIKPGETLQTVADKYKVNVDDLARFNGYSSPADAKPGDGVLIP
ncbi:MAG TPA: LysM peptidoglycan-binding domain-containing protein [Chloroflexia bacterium]|nr:LysM peptidoglycan-binding domain-containing protein [Chloroflexia bacterium]